MYHKPKVRVTDIARTSDPNLIHRFNLTSPNLSANLNSNLKVVDSVTVKNARSFYSSLPTVAQQKENSLSPKLLSSSKGQVKDENLVEQKLRNQLDPSGLDQDLSSNPQILDILPQTSSDCEGKKSSHGESKSKETSHSINTDDKLRLKEILEKLMYIDNSQQKWFDFNKMIEKKSYQFEDPTPDLIEGVFFVPVRNWANIVRCRSQKIYIKICVFDAHSFFVFSHKHRLRKLVVCVTESSEFQNLTLIVIMLTTITLIIYDYNNNTLEAKSYNEVLDQINMYSTYYYLVECLFKLFAQGVIMHPNAYFRDGWNWFDVAVIFAGLTETTNLPNIPIKSLRAFRVLRPLKSIRQLPRLRKLISGLLNSIPHLLNALFFIFFVFLQFSIFGSQQFSGAYYNRCRLTEGITNGVWPIDESQTSLCSKDGRGYQCINGTFCGEPTDLGLDYRNESSFLNDLSIFGYGISNFNNPAIGLATIFQCITLEGWSKIMFDLMDQQFYIFVVPFFVMLVIVGAFFLIHAILAVLGYQMSQNEMLETSEENKAKTQLATSLKRKEKQLELEQSKDNQENIKTQIRQELDQLNTAFKISPELVTELQIFETENEQENNTAEKSEAPTTNRALINGAEQEHVQAEVINGNQVQQNDPQHPETQVNMMTNEQEGAESPTKRLSLKRTSTTIRLYQRASKNICFWWCYQICSSSTFQIGMYAVVIVNAIIMALDRYPQPVAQSRQFDLINEVFSWVFLVEMVVKVAGIGITDYVRDKFNLFDAFIVILSLVDNIIFYSLGNSVTGGGLIVLRSVRLLRIFKLARSWTSFRILLQKILDAMPNLLTFSLLLLIISVVFVIIGMQFFSGAIYLDSNNKIVQAGQGIPPLNNFETLYNATTTVFAVMMVDNWHQIMFEYIRSKGVGAQAYFIATVMILNTIMMNLLLALILEIFDSQTKNSNQEQDDQESTVVKSVQIKILNFLRWILEKLPVLSKKFNLTQKLDQLEIYLVKIEEEQEQGELSDGESESENFYLSRSLRMLSNIHEFETEQRKNWKRNEEKEQTEKRRRMLSISQVVKNDALHQIVKAQTKQDMKIAGKSLGLFTPDHNLRKLCVSILSFKYFDDISNLMVILSTVQLAIDNPLDDPNSKKQIVLNKLDYTMTAIFSVEAIIKIISLGFLFNGPKSYFRKAWNKLDFFVIFVSFLTYLPLGQNLQFYKSMRLIRILRPLRMIQRNAGLRIAVKSLQSVLPGVLNLVLISVLNIGLLAVLGVNLFKGKFYRCDMANVPNAQQSKVMNMWDCQDLGGEWRNPDQHFDNFFRAVLSVTQIMNTECWYSIFTNAQQTTSAFQMPSPMASKTSFLYFIFVILIQAVFMTNLFVGEVISIFNQESRKSVRNCYLTSLEFEYIDTCISCLKLKPLKSFKHRLLVRRICYHITESEVFQGFVNFCILSNTITLAFTWYGQSASQAQIVDYCNMGLTGVYALEFILKVTAFGLAYFEDGWNLLDCSVVLFALIGYIVQYVVGENYTIALTVIRAFRVTRLLKLIRSFKELRRIAMTFIQSMPDIVNIGSLLFLFLFMFVILSMNLFAGVKLQSELNVKKNFQSFGTALLTLFILSTGEEWPELMADSARQRSIYFRCESQQSFEDIQLTGVRGCGSIASYAFFIIFWVFVSYVMLNLFIAIILEGFKNQLIKETQKLKPETFEVFQSIWVKYDPDGTGMILIDNLEQVILDIVDEEQKLLKKLPQKQQKESDQVLFDLRHSKLLTLSALWRRKEDDGSVAYRNVKNSVFFQRQLKKHLMYFIGQLQIPTYNKLMHFNFYDVLRSFVDFSFTQRHRYEYFQRKELISSLDHTKQFLSRLDKIELFSEEYMRLPRADKERLLELESEHFINVVQNIERKGKQQGRKIERIATMQAMRRRQVQINKESLDDFDDQVMCSKYIMAAKVIIRAIVAFKERRRTGSTLRMMKNKPKMVLPNQNPLTMNYSIQKKELDLIKVPTPKTAQIKKPTLLKQAAPEVKTQHIQSESRVDTFGHLTPYYSEKQQRQLNLPKEKDKVVGLESKETYDAIQTSGIDQNKVKPQLAVSNIKTTHSQVNLQSAKLSFTLDSPTDLNTHKTKNLPIKQGSDQTQQLKEGNLSEMQNHQILLAPLNVLPFYESQVQGPSEFNEVKAQINSSVPSQILLVPSKPSNNLAVRQNSLPPLLRQSVGNLPLKNPKRQRDLTPKAYGKQHRLVIVALSQASQLQVHQKIIKSQAKLPPLNRRLKPIKAARDKSSADRNNHSDS